MERLAVLVEHANSSEVKTIDQRLSALVLVGLHADLLPRVIFVLELLVNGLQPNYLCDTLPVLDSALLKHSILHRLEAVVSGASSPRAERIIEDDGLHEDTLPVEFAPFDLH